MKVQEFEATCASKTFGKPKPVCAQVLVAYPCFSEAMSLIFITKDEGLCPYHVPLGHLCPLESIREREPLCPTLDELELLTIDSMKSFAKNCGLKIGFSGGVPTKKHYKEAIVENWEKIAERVVSGIWLPDDVAGAKKLMVIQREDGYLLALEVFGGMVLHIDEIDSTDTTPPSEKLLKSLTVAQMKTLALNLNPDTKVNKLSPIGLINRIREDWQSLSFFNARGKALEKKKATDLEKMRAKGNPFASKPSDECSDESTSVASPCSSDCMSITDLVCRLADEELQAMTASSEVVNVHVKECKGGRVLTTLSVSADTTICDFKSFICGKIGFDASSMDTLTSSDFKLIYNNLTMKDDQQLSDFTEGETDISVYLFLTLRGGAKQTKKTLKVKQYLISEKRSELTEKAKAYSQEKFAKSADIAKTSRERIERFYNIMETNPEQAFKELLSSVPTSVLGCRENSELMEAIKSGVRADVRIENFVKILAKHNFKEAYDMMQEYQTLIESALLTGEMLITKRFLRDDGAWDWQMMKRYIDDEMVRREQPSSSADASMRDA